MQRDLHWSRSFLSGAFSLALVVSALLTIPIGHWLDRHEPRPLFLITALVATTFVVAWGLASGKALYILIWVVLGACQAVVFYDAAFTVLAKRFSGDERNRAITNVTLVAGLASTIFAPLVAALEHAFGWRGAVVGLAIILGGVTVPGYGFGLRDPAPAHDELPPEAESLPRDVLRTVSFWLLVVAYSLSAVTVFGVGVHLVPFLKSRGMPTGRAALALGAVGFVQVLGRGAYLRLSSGHRAVRLATGVLAAKAAGIVALLTVPGWPGVVVFVLVYGSSNGMSTLTRATTVAELYGRRHYGAINGVIASVNALAGAAAPFAVAFATDVIGREAPVFGGLAAVSFLAAAANEVVARWDRGVFVGTPEPVPDPLL